jgi:hypothetical protein
VDAGCHVTLSTIRYLVIDTSLAVDTAVTLTCIKIMITDAIFILIMPLKHNIHGTQFDVYSFAFTEGQG